MYIFSFCKQLNKTSTLFKFPDFYINYYITNTSHMNKCRKALF